jgi:cell division septation protein DedD
MAKESALREPERGEKSALIRELLAKYPEKRNSELAAMYLAKMQAMKVKEDRDLAKIAQSFAQEKSASKSRQETPAPKAAAAPTTPVAKPATTTASNGAKETTTMSALRQLVGLVGKDGAKALVDSL